MACRPCSARAPAARRTWIRSRPIRSISSAEYYFGEQALFSVGLFYKDVSTFIVQQQQPETYNGVNYLVNRKINGEGAEVQGRRSAGAAAVLFPARTRSTASA